MAKKAIDVLKQEYPVIYNGYKEIIDEQFELFAKKHLDYGMGNVSAGTQFFTDPEGAFGAHPSRRDRSEQQ